VEADPDRPDLYLNLGRVCLKQLDRAHAFRTFVRGLRLDPNHAGLIEALRRLGFRRRPVIAFLPRHHPVNQLLGSLRAAWMRHARPGRKIRSRAA
jgi:Tfp pilus assembly protein PilF